MQVASAGGHADNRKSRDEKLFNVFNLTKEPARSIDSGLLLRWVWEHKHPRFLTVNVAIQKSNEEARELLGLPQVGTMYFATTLGREWMEEPIPRGELPYQSIVKAEWDPVRMRWNNDAQVRGWQPFLVQLSKNGFLRPSRRLNYLLGQDSFSLVPRHLHP